AGVDEAAARARAGGDAVAGAGLGAGGGVPAAALCVDQDALSFGLGRQAALAGDQPRLGRVRGLPRGEEIDAGAVAVPAAAGDGDRVAADAVPLTVGADREGGEGGCWGAIVRV